MTCLAQSPLLCHSSLSPLQITLCLLAATTSVYAQRQFQQQQNYQQQQLRQAPQQQQQPQQQQYQDYQQQAEIAAAAPVQAAPKAQAQQQYQQPKQETSTWIPILKYNKQQGDDGSYQTEYETGNQILAAENGYIRDKSEQLPGGVLVQQGQYSYISPEGQVINVQYTADDKGFHASGDHIPTPPPVPEEIQKGLDQIYEGIRLNREREEAEARANPAEYAKKQEERARLNYNGQYYP